MKKKNKIIAFLLVASFLVAVPGAYEHVYAKTAQDKKDEAEKELQNQKDQINDLNNKKDQVDSQISTTKSKLNKLMAQQEALEKEINSTQKDITRVQAELEVARDDAAKQYEAMKLRIQYMYENSTADSYWTAIIGADGIADLLKRVEYVSTIQKADRELTAQYEATVEKVEAKEVELLAKLDTLLMKEEMYLGQQAEMVALVSSLNDSKKEYTLMLANAEKKANELQQVIKQQEEIIRQEQSGINNPNAGNQNVSGKELVDYALQFVGNPYVWGGNSLTKGCDCSGFVHLIYKNFGYNTVRYSMSFQYEGKAVKYEDMKPGDIVVYAKKNGIGHVGIYIGNGKIVEAQSSEKGITANRAVNCREIVAIRRLLKNP